MQVIQAFVNGRNKPEAIAHSLGLKPSSVKTYIERLYERLDAHSRAEVMVLVFTELLQLREDSRATAATTAPEA